MQAPRSAPASQPVHVSEHALAQPKQQPAIPPRSLPSPTATAGPGHESRVSSIETIPYASAPGARPAVAGLEPAPGDADSAQAGLHHPQSGVPAPAATHAEVAYIPNYEELDDLLDVRLPREPEYIEPDPSPAPPLGIRIPSTVSLSKTAPLCWDWPVAEPTEVAAQRPDHADALPEPRAGRGPADTVTAFWVNPRAAEDHALSASHAAALIMWPLLPQRPPAHHAPAADACLPEEQAPPRRQADAVAVDRSPDTAAQQTDTPAEAVGGAAMNLQAVGDSPPDMAPAAAARTAHSVGVKPLRNSEAQLDTVPTAVAVSPRGQTAVAGLPERSPNGVRAESPVRPPRPAAAAKPAQLVSADRARQSPASPSAGPAGQSERQGVATEGAVAVQPDSPGDRNPPDPAERSEAAAESGRASAPTPGRRRLPAAGTSRLRTHGLCLTHCREFVCRCSVDPSVAGYRCMLTMYSHSIKAVRDGLLCSHSQPSGVHVA